MWTIARDDLTAADSRALVALHLAGMHAQTPAESVHAIGIEKLQDPSVIFVTARDTAGRVGGMAAVQLFGDGDGELKSMRTADHARGTGLGRLLLEHITELARAADVTTLWLETGSSDDFVAARGLYASAGFTACAPFADYEDDPLSVFMSKTIG